MNALLCHERSRQARIRNSLDDLAHSLKTPLAVLRGVVDQSETGTKADVRLLGEQVGRIDQIVRYQLHRVAARGRQGFLHIEPVEPILRQLVGALAKVYKSKNIKFDVRLDGGLRLRADPDDLMEILGNVLDNACKWCRLSVSIRGGQQDRRVVLYVEDDGPGFPDGLAESLIQRGARADTQVEGQGIGLAVVSEIVSGYGGRLELGRSDIGGARVKLDLPAG
jgi:two-component system sensor histidine kinase PhoQ